MTKPTPRWGAAVDRACKDIQDVYEKRTAGDHTWLGVLAYSVVPEFLRMDEEIDSLREQLTKAQNELDRSITREQQLDLALRRAQSVPAES